MLPVNRRILGLYQVERVHNLTDMMNVLGSLCVNMVEHIKHRMNLPKIVKMYYNHNQSQPQVCLYQCMMTQLG